MAQKILNTFRKLVLSSALRVLPLSLSKLQEPEPVSASLTPASDPWLFDTPLSLAGHVTKLSREMIQLSDRLAQLHTVISYVSSYAPAPIMVAAAPAPVQVLWADDFLFDGEPMPKAAVATTSDELDGLLFDDLGGAETGDLGLSIALFEKARHAPVRKLSASWRV